MHFFKTILTLNILTVLFAFVFTGCTVQPKYTYVNKDIDKKNAYHEFKIQKSKCIIELNRTLSEPMPIDCEDKLCEENKEKELNKYLTIKEEHFEKCMNKQGYKKSYLPF